MDQADLPADLQQAIAFHGHLCPGLMIGWRAARAAMAALGLSRSPDEELVTVAENDSCSVDAFQVLLGTTFGKGNLKWLDHGKQVFTVSDRKQNRAVRVVFTGDGSRPRLPGGGVDRPAFMRLLLEAPDDQILSLREVPPSPPDMARIEPSLSCARCGESVQQSKSVPRDGQALCRPCAGEARS